MDRENIMIEVHGARQVIRRRCDIGDFEDLDIPYTVVGEVCDSKEFDDRCTTECHFYRSGTCPAVRMRDNFGALWHVIISDSTIVGPPSDAT